MRDPIVIPITEVVTRWGEFNSILDARSPAEFEEDHLPGAMNTPVLDNAERAQVGLCHAQQGAFEAKRMGAAIVARNIGMLIAQHFAQQDRSWSPLVYCWRGGNRSGALATVLARVGWRTHVLDGGYKAFRRWVIEDLERRVQTLRFVVVGGRTGSAKSRLLHRLRERGEQVLDLEGLAVHRGSVLGSLPGSAQPSQKGFETQIWDALRSLDPSRPVFVESESRKVGRVQCPEGLIHRIRSATVALIEADTGTRSHFLLAEYAHFRTDPAAFMALLDCLSPLHGHERVDLWKALIGADRWQEVVIDLLEQHYDPSYDRSMKRNFMQLDRAPRITLVDTSEAALDAACDALIRLAEPLAFPISG